MGQVINVDFHRVRFGRRQGNMNNMEWNVILAYLVLVSLLTAAWFSMLLLEWP